jgi:hypothetical protein
MAEAAAVPAGAARRLLRLAAVDLSGMGVHEYNVWRQYIHNGEPMNIKFHIVSCAFLPSRRTAGPGG